jgi:hypothetical protein
MPSPNTRAVALEYHKEVFTRKQIHHWTNREFANWAFKVLKAQDFYLTGMGSAPWICNKMTPLYIVDFDVLRTISDIAKALLEDTYGSSKMLSSKYD